MNKKFLLSIVTIAVAGFGFLAFNSQTDTKQYSPRQIEVEGISGYQEYINNVRANEKTGTVTNIDVQNALSEIRDQRNVKFKADWPLEWEFQGPDNMGGRTRCLVIDEENPNIMYTGGVSGSVFKSTNKGASWKALTLGDDNFGVVSMAQAEDGSIVYGTGEAGLLLTSIVGSEQSGFQGMGMYKSIDGETFSSVPGSNAFGNIYVISRNPVDNNLYAGSSNGLRVSTDNGDSWTLVRPGSCRDIKFNKNGVAVVLIGNIIWRSLDPTNRDSYKQTTIGNQSRAAVAWSESDPDYCYVVAVNNRDFDGQSYRGALSGLFRSTDAGATWTQEVGQLSRFFAPFTIIGLQAQGEYNIAIGVHPRDKDRVFIGGIDFAEWTLDGGPKIVGNRFDKPTNPFGIHSDKHFITFDNTGDDPIMYICNDGGVSRTTNAELTNYQDISTGLITTQFFEIAASSAGVLLGGTQDQSTILLTGEAFPRKKGETVLGGDGFQTEISEFNNQIMFGESQYGNLRRSVKGGIDMEEIWDNRIEASFSSTARNTNYFNNPFTLWENPAVLNSVKTNGEQVNDDTLLDARLYFAMDDGVWMAKNALLEKFDPNEPKNQGAIRWFRISNIRNVHNIEPTLNGTSVFVTTSRGRVYRIDSVLSTQFDTTSLPGYDQIASSLVTTDISNNLGVGTRTVTSVAIDNNDPNRIVATIGNYNNSNYVYLCEDALSDNPSWRSIQGNLPRIPVYHAVISVDDPSVIILGTEFGVWATNSGTATTPTWAEALDGVDEDMPFPRVPVFDLVQVENKSWSGPRIYAGTHGMGIWGSLSLLTNVRDNNTVIKEETAILAYPNPANNYVNIQTEILGSYTLSVHDITGKVVSSETGTNNGFINLNTTELLNGNYFVEVLGDGEKAVTKIIVQH